MPKGPFTTIIAIYNPNSTGDSSSMAKDLRRKLKDSISVKMMPTKYAGHAEELAYELAKKHRSLLLLSVSGDGGYNEVVNGAMKAQREGSSPVVAVVPAGNANDHASAMGSDDLVTAIKKGLVKKIDILKITATKNGHEHITRYAHSYAGMGLTAVIATELNQKELNPINEKWLVLKKLYRYRPFTIRHHGKVKKLDSLLFANINRMAKVLTISEKNTPNDGKFEVVELPYQKKRTLVKILIKASITSLKPKSYQSYNFETVKKTLMQVDGEVLEIPAGCKVVVSSEKQVLRTIY